MRFSAGYEPVVEKIHGKGSMFLLWNPLSDCEHQLGFRQDICTAIQSARW